MNGGNLPVITEMARRFARYEAMADIKREFRELAGTNTVSNVKLCRGKWGYLMCDLVNTPLF